VAGKLDDSDWNGLGMDWIQIDLLFDVSAEIKIFAWFGHI